jgi:hypothetical protein
MFSLLFRHAGPLLFAQGILAMGPQLATHQGQSNL